MNCRVLITMKIAGNDINRDIIYYVYNLLDTESKIHLLLTANSICETINNEKSKSIQMIMTGNVSDNILIVFGRKNAIKIIEYAAKNINISRKLWYHVSKCLQLCVIFKNIHGRKFSKHELAVRDDDLESLRALKNIKFTGAGGFLCVSEDVCINYAIEYDSCECFKYLIQHLHAHDRYKFVKCFISKLIDLSRCNILKYILRNYRSNKYKSQYEKDIRIYIMSDDKQLRDNRMTYICTENKFDLFKLLLDNNILTLAEAAPYIIKNVNIKVIQSYDLSELLTSANFYNMLNNLLCRRALVFELDIDNYYKNNSLNEINNDIGELYKLYWSQYPIFQ